MGLVKIHINVFIVCSEDEEDESEDEEDEDETDNLGVEEQQHTEEVLKHLLHIQSN